MWDLIAATASLLQMEHCESTLRALIDGSAGPPDGLTNETRWRLFRQTLEALAYMHGRGLLHRDIK